MLKRIITSLKRTLRLPVIMSEQAAPEKRACDEAPEGKESKKQKNIVPNTEASADRKRKVALLIAYNGKGYYGLQVNPGFPTVESELCKALLNVGVIPQDHHDAMQKMSFQRAARTDKGVSAASNLVSLKMLLNVDNLVEKINEQLPLQIRVMDCKRTTNSFNSKNFCDARTYIYMLPTFAFAPVQETVTYSYRTTPEIMAHVNKVLKMYLGTHQFHNFTSGIKAEEKKSRRYIKNIECGKPFVRNDVEFAVISVLGQSFMLHQIRKMVGLCIAAVKGYCGAEAIDLAWNPEKMDVPKAPGLGLVLEKLHYDGYNKRYGGDGLHEALDWSQIQDKLDQFKEEKIFSEIIKTEIEENVMMDWLSKLQLHSYDTEENWFMKRKTIAYHLSSKDEKKKSPSPTVVEDNSVINQNMDTDEQSKTDTVTNQTEISASSQNIDNVIIDKIAKNDLETDTTIAVDEHITTEHQSLKVNSDKSDSQRTVDTKSDAGLRQSDTNGKLDNESDVAENDFKKAEKNL